METYELTEKEKQTLQAMMEQEAQDQEELNRKLRAMTPEQREAYIKEQSHMGSKMDSSLPSKE